MERVTINRLVIVIAVVLIAGVAALAFLLTKASDDKPVSPVAVTTTPPALTDQNRALLEQLGSDLAQKFFTYNAQGSATYLQSLRPYLTDAFYNDTVRSTKSSERELRPSSSTVEGVKIVSLSNDEAVTQTRLTIANSEFRYKQLIEFGWQKNNDRWQATYMIVRDNDEEPLGR